MRILITGGCGFLGSHIVEHFVKNTDHEIVILDRMTYASSGLDRLRDIHLYDQQTGVFTQLLKSGRVTVLGCDLAKPIPPGVSQEIGQVDYVIHAAAETHVDHSIRDPLPFYEANVIGTHNLLWWAKEQMIKRVFLVSTDEVYGPKAWDQRGDVETDPFRPANPYAAAKAGGEAVAMAYENTYKVPVTIVNTMNLIGERQHREKFVPMVIRRVLCKEKVQIHADPTCTRPGTRFYLHCRNYAAALLFLMHRHMDGARDSELPIKVHVSGEREINNLELARMIADAVGGPLIYELVNFHESRPGHDLRYALNDNLIRSMGWSCPVTIDQSIERTVKWFLDNKKWLGL